MTSSIPVFDADSHLAEVPDLWTSRLPLSKWGEDVPHVVFDERLKRDRWVIGGRMLTSVANWAVAGWNEFPPEHPPTVDDADPGAFEAVPRLQRMDEYGIYCQALYPNLLAFSHHAFMAIKDPALQIACIRAYNDHLVDFASADPKRFVLPGGGRGIRGPPPAVRQADRLVPGHQAQVRRSATPGRVGTLGRPVRRERLIEPVG
jgi:hypothetical protein